MLAHSLLMRSRSSWAVLLERMDLIRSRTRDVAGMVAGERERGRGRGEGEARGEKTD